MQSRKFLTDIPKGLPSWSCQGSNQYLIFVPSLGMFNLFFSDLSILSVSSVELTYGPNSLYLFLSWKVFISPSITTGSFAEYSHLGWHFWCFMT